MKHKRFNLFTKHYYYYTQELTKLKLSSLFYFISRKTYDPSFLFKFFFIRNLKTKSKKRNYCSISGRYQGLNNKFNISRIEMRNINSLRLFAGLRKINW